MDTKTKPIYTLLTKDRSKDEGMGKSIPYNPFVKYVSHIIILYTLNLQSDMYQLYNQ